jgi:hypothetical protein
VGSFLIVRESKRARAWGKARVTVEGSNYGRGGGRGKMWETTTTTKEGENKVRKAKAYTRLINIETKEVVGEGELSPACVKRLIKLYAQFGYYLEAVA